ncbi:hypothetical protein AeRB84_001328 [Aphanomyces euteiches]|nr:hypothetical protein AeRB84_001328 [Aphanomyces euteiches]
MRRALVALFGLSASLSTEACRDVQGSPVKWTWIGALTSSSFRLRVSTAFEDPLCDPSKVSLWLYSNDKSDSPVQVQGKRRIMSPTKSVHDFQAKDLLPGAVSYEVRYDNSIVLKRSNRSIHLPGIEGTPQSFKFAFSSCADEDSDPQVFKEIERHDPLFFVHMGDLHYANIEVNDVNVFRNAYESMFESPAGQAMLAMEFPMAYMWDDHDYGPDNSDGTAPGRVASLVAYREYAPHYPLADSDPLGPIQQAFTISRVRFLMTDLRSQRTPNTDPDVPTKTVLGAKQMKWFQEQLLAAAAPEIGLIVWVNTMPWIDDERKWGHFTHEQRAIVEFLRTNNLNSQVPIIIISGDAHMLAVDDGSFSPGNLTTFHAAALGRPGSTKGGPYSHGMFPGSGQFGVMDVHDDGEKICLTYSGRRFGTELLAYDTCHTVVGETYYPPPKFVRVLTRTWKKLQSRVISRWNKSQAHEIVGMALLAVLAVALTRRWLKRHEKVE